MILDILLKYTGWLLIAICLLAAGDVFRFVTQLQHFLIWVMK